MTAPMTDLLALKARVDAATGPDRELFLAVWHALGLNAQWREDNGEAANAEALAYERFEELVDVGAWTDAALALIRHARPAWAWSDAFQAGLRATPQDPALALVSALLAALLAQQEQDDGR